jgi:prepilin-type N-terminal cleavage/methylation domain-containing protein
MKRIASSRGFTLIELLTVVSIISLLASAIFSSMSEAQRRSRDATRLADIKQIQNALELYADENGGMYPLVPTSFVHELTDELQPNYIRVLPEDPVRTGSNRYRYYTASATNASSYTIMVNLETDDPDVGWCRIQLGPGYPQWNPPLQNYPACDL